MTKEAAGMRAFQDRIISRYTNHSSVSIVLFLGTFYLYSAGLVQPTDSSLGAFSARILELKNDPTVKVAPVKRVLRSIKCRN